MVYTSRQRLRNFPKVHLIAASLCAAIIGLTLVLLPSEEVSATRSTQNIQLPVESTLSLPKAQIELTPVIRHIEPTPPSLPTDSAPTPEESAAEEVEQTTSLPTEIVSSNEPSQIQPDESWESFIIGSGDTLSGVFEKAGLGVGTVYAVANSDKTFNRIYPGQELAFLKDSEGKLLKLRLIHSPLKSTLLTRTDTGYRSEAIERQPDIQHRYAHGSIEDSLFLSAANAGLSNRKIMELASIFAWDVDFVLDIRKGDSFNVMYEELYLDGEKISEGRILAAQFTNQGKTYTALRYTDSQSNTSYFTPEGRSMRKAFLRSPVDFARISSRFNLKRKHPVLNRIRAHKGVDYAARTGTPIKAAGDGKIIHRGKKGGYGNVVILQHGGNITTLYAHMSRFKKGLRKGSRVKQGQVIGYVGSTGLASGPHLHYEFRVNGVHKNPMTVKLPTAQPVAKSERSRFKANAGKLMAQLETFSATQLAQAENE
ncbi:OapA family protein [Marinobacterium jannaschii]|uniref:OapA family protein n=1 Tax=Marinobacterium jannaschii TaxID=64970 RepID=UPI000485F0C6|nr:peptidoglycan DD-metalloendopeptidase family protein [Marinobacterium jannaschii]